MRTIVFCFAGRRENLELQLPFIKKVLAEHPNTEYHIWDFSRGEDDHRYVQAIEGERITVFDHYDGWSEGQHKFSRAYDLYAGARYQDCVFVKVDDDIVFIEVDQWANLIKAITANPGSIVSAKVINNGACIQTEPALQHSFEALAIPLGEVYRSPECADMCHDYMFGHWHELIGQPVKLIPMNDWLAINLIGYSWEMACEITRLLKGPGVYARVEGRPDWTDLSFTDEGVSNRLPRLVLQGFLACHLSFQNQHRGWEDDYVAGLRSHYAEIGQGYRAMDRPVKSADLPVTSTTFPMDGWWVASARSRAQFLEDTIPKGGVGVELGVFKGDFTRVILAVTDPKRLHVVDPWYLLGGSWDWVPGSSTVEAVVGVLRSFTHELVSGQMVLHIDDDLRILPTFPDHYFDWAYLDTTHSYEQTVKELELLKAKVKPSGIIAGDDWATDPAHHNHGVCRAVQEFLKREPYDLVYAQESAAVPSWATGQWAISRTTRQDFRGAIYLADGTVIL